MPMIIDDAPIKFIPSSALDRDKYRACIRGSLYPVGYAEPSCLDLMAKQWSALVLGDYDAVMPLPWNRKWGFRYVYNPAFVPQLGIFSSRPLTIFLQDRFFSELKNRFSFCELFLNPGNRQEGLRNKTNFILPLSPAYNHLRENYKKDLKDRLQKARALTCRVTNDPETVVGLYRDLYGKRFRHVTAADYSAFSALAAGKLAAGQLLCREVRDEPTGSLLAANIFLKDNARITNIMAVTIPEGRQRFAQHFLLDSIIREYAGQPLLLDFEGSEIPGVAAFYQRFGAVTESYPLFRYNGLPFPFRLLKREKDFAAL